MQIQVNTNNVSIVDKEQIESGEYNVTPCLFTFSSEYVDLIKTALFTNKEQKTYKMDIINNQCAIPSEVLTSEGMVQLGVYAYEEQNGDLLLRYSPKSSMFYVTKGSYKENSENSVPPTPTQFEQYEEALEAGLTEVQNVNIDVNKSGTISTVTITNRNGTTKTVQILDGEKGDKRRQR